jgi:hypothetical protein
VLGFRMMTPAEIATLYRDYAAECKSFAEVTYDAAGKLALLDIARIWVDLAEQAEKDEPISVVYGPPDSKATQDHVEPPQ